MAAERNSVAQGGRQQSLAAAEGSHDAELRAQIREMQHQRTNASVILGCAARLATVAR